MGKINGFLEYERENNTELSPLERIKNYHEFHTPLAKEERRKQAARCMNCGVPFCNWGQPVGTMVAGCPLHNLIPEFNDALYHDQPKQAFERLISTNIFPEFTSRVCPALCEKACTCGLNGDPVSVKENEFEIIETAFANGWMKPKEIAYHSDKKIAVIGSGPSGLACANVLNQRGHHVTVFEKHDRFGGLLMYGIPNMKLEKQIIQRRIDLMKEEGVTFEANKPIDTKAKAKRLLEQYDAIVLCCGSEKPRSLQLEGMDSEGVVFAVDYLTQATKGVLGNTTSTINAKDKNVVIVGGGDTGNDCVGTAIRQGCKSVMQLEMMPEPPLERTPNNPWPEWPLVKKTDYGQQEAIALYHKDPRSYKTTVKQIYTEKGKIVSVDLIETERKIVDGKPTFVNDEKSVRNVPCDLLLIAAGFIGCNDVITSAFSLPTERGRVTTTNYQVTDKLFSCGDMRRGQSLVVHAINEGMQCAKVVDSYLNGYENI